MAWQNPKTNWVAGDIPGAGDFNRIEGNIQTIATTLAAVESLQAGTAFAYYLTPPGVALDSYNTDYDNWWVQNVNSSVAIRILLPGTIRYHLEHRVDSPSAISYVRILRNGYPLYAEGSSSTSWQTVPGILPVSPGDIVTIQKRTSDSSYAAYWRNVRIETDQPPLGIQRF